MARSAVERPLALVDVGATADAGWLLACVWPDTDRLGRMAASIALAQHDLPQVVAGDANEVLHDVLAALPEGAAAAVLTTWAFAYFSIDDRARFLELLKVQSHTRPLTWLSAEGAGTVDAFAGAGSRATTRRHRTSWGR